MADHLGIGVAARAAGAGIGLAGAAVAATGAVVFRMFGTQLLGRRLGQAGGQLDEILRQRGRGRDHAGQLLDIAQVRLFVRRAVAHCQARTAGTGGAADAVDILFGHVGQFEVEHGRHARHVNAACGNVGCHQHRHAAGTEAIQRAGALGLALVAVDRSGFHSGGDKVADHAVGPVLGTGEHQRAFDLAAGNALLQRQGQQGLLFLLLDEGDILLHPLGRGRLRGNLHLHRVGDELLAQAGDLFGHGGREEQALPLGRQQAGDLGQRLDEAQVHHLVGLVQHEDLDMVEHQGALVDQVQQAAGRGHQDIDPAAKAGNLLADRHPAEHGLDRQVQELGIEPHVVGNLRRQLARGAQHQHPAAARETPGGIGGQAVQRRQREGGRLAGAGLGNAQQVTAFHQGGDRLPLDGGGIVVTLGFQSA